MNISTQQAKKQTLIFSFKKLETVEFVFFMILHPQYFSRQKNTALLNSLNV